VVALCGVIGFVGILVPAMARLIGGWSHRVVLPVAFFSGGILLVCCDLLGRVMSPPYEIPVGVFTALLGGPAFVLLLLRSSWRV
jgi:iron complex transport system permease protein